MDRGKLLIKREESGIFTLFINFLIPFGQNVNSQSLPILSRNWYNINLFQKFLLFYRLTHSRLSLYKDRPQIQSLIRAVIAVHDIRGFSSTTVRQKSRRETVTNCILFI